MFSSGKPRLSLNFVGLLIIIVYACVFLPETYSQQLQELRTSQNKLKLIEDAIFDANNQLKS